MRIRTNALAALTMAGALVLGSGAIAAIAAPDVNLPPRSCPTNYKVLSQSKGTGTVTHVHWLAGTVDFTNKEWANGSTATMRYLFAYQNTAGVDLWSTGTWTAGQQNQTCSL